MHRTNKLNVTRDELINSSHMQYRKSKVAQERIGFLMIVILCFFTNQSYSQSYCESESSYHQRYISHVQINNDINNYSTGESYTDNTGLSTTVYQGQNNVQLYIGGVYTDRYSDLSVWVDWNDNGVFTNDAEKLFCIKDFSHSPFPLEYRSFNIPSTAHVGQVRMRIKLSYFSWNYCDPCGNYSYGETEDYTLNIVEGLNNYNTFGGGAKCSSSDKFSVHLSKSQLNATYKLLHDGIETGNSITGDGGPISFTDISEEGNYTIKASHPTLPLTRIMPGEAIISNAIPNAPTIDNVVHPDCSTPTGNIQLSNLPDGRPWKITQSPGNIEYTGTGTTRNITGLTPGTYNFTVTVGDENTSCPGTGEGLSGKYYNSLIFGGTPTLTRTDANINFNWSTGTPGSGIGQDNFTACWSGKIVPCYSENYTFRTYSDDGVRLTINGTTVVENWTDHAQTYNTGSIDLVAGQPYDIVLEFYEKGGYARMELEWSSPSQAQQIIPKNQLYLNSHAFSECSSPTSANVVINPQPQSPTPPTSIVADRTNFCTSDAGNITLTATGGTGTNFQWYSASCGGTSIGSGTSLTIPSPTETTSYYGRWENACGNSTCESVEVNVLPLPTVTAIASSQDICYGENVTLSGNGASTYTWNNGATNEIPISLNTTTTFTVIGEDTNGCTNTDQITVNVGAPINFTVSNDTTICEGGSASLKVNIPSSEKSLYFNGVNTSVAIADHDSINLSVVHKRTVAFWFNITNTTSRQMLFEEGGGVNGFSVFVENNQIKYHAWEADNTWGTISKNITANTWYYATFVFDKTASESKYFKGYLDGVFLGSINNTNGSDGMHQHSGDVNIGISDGNLRYPDNSKNSNNYPTQGYIDEFKLWNRALTQEDIKLEMFNANDGTQSGSNLIVYYNFNNEGNTAVDLSGGNNGSINGSVNHSNTNPFEPSIVWAPNGETTSNINVTPTSTTTYHYTLTRPTNNCQTSGSITVTVQPMLTPSITAASPVCSGSEAVFSVNGTAGNIVTYDGAISGSITLDAEGNGKIVLSSIESSSTINLTSVSNSDCTKILTGISAEIAITPRPTITLQSSQASLCHGDELVTLTYTSTTQEPSHFSIDMIDPGIPDINDEVLSSNIIQFSLPNTLPAKSYNADLVVKNNICESTIIPITIIINPLPDTGTIIPD